MADKLILFVSDWAEATWDMLVDSAFLFLIGLALAGLISVFLTSDIIARYARGGRFKSVLRASLVGVPLPLCSCSVLPVAAQLRQSGVSRAGTTAFLIATPESGADSIALTYSLTDPLLTIARPVSAFATAFAAGLIQKEDHIPGPAGSATESCTDECGCQNAANPVSLRSSVAARIGSGIKYAFTDLIGDLAPYLLVGYVLAGLLDSILGAHLTELPSIFKTGPISYFGAILVGLPLYICATSSTPLAAVLLLHGFSPGAILVLLLVGPATNIASLVVVKRILGGPGTLRYLAAVVVVAIICGVICDNLYGVFHLKALYGAAEVHEVSGLLYTMSAIILAALIVGHTSRKYIRQL
jgi:uncharacterized membrane protein YraQ (UPF0718 family)